MMHIDLSSKDSLIRQFIRRSLLGMKVFNSGLYDFPCHQTYLKYQNLHLVNYEEESQLETLDSGLREAPIIFTEGFRLREKIDQFFYYKPANGYSVTPAEHDLSWKMFNSLHYQKSSHGNYAKDLIARAIIDCRRQYGNDSAIEFVRSLWSHHWIFGRFTAANLLTYAWGVDSEEDWGKLRSDKDFIFEQFDEIESALNYIKQTCISLDQWLWGLYLIGPDAHFIYKLSRGSDDDEIEKVNRILDEIGADTVDVYFRCERSMLNDPYLIDFYIKGMRKDRDIKDIDIEKLKITLEFESRYRTHLPQYWVDKALKFLRSENYDGLSELNCFNTILLDSIICTSMGLYGLG